MGRILLQVLLMSVRFVWLILGVLPGHLLMLAHSRALAARGHPASALLPVTFYRLVGFVLTTVLCSGLNALLIRVGSG